MKRETKCLALEQHSYPKCDLQRMQNEILWTGVASNPV